MDKPSSSHPPHKSSAGRRVRLIPSTPRQENATLPPTQPVPDTNVGTSRPPETFGGNLYSRIINEAMAKLRDYGSTADETNSGESLRKSVTTLSTRASPTSSSSLRFSNGQTFEGITAEVIREMREVKEKGEVKGTLEAGEPVQIHAEEASRENPIREIYDLTEIEDEEEIGTGDWRIQMENTVNQLLVENAEQNAMIKAQREQITKMVDIVDRIIAYMDWGPQPSHRPSPAISAAGQNEPSRNAPDPNVAGPSRKRKDTATTSQPQSEAKRTKHSGSPGSQRKN